MSRHGSNAELNGRGGDGGSLSAFLASRASLSDDRLADEIRREARRRESASEPIDLRTFLETIEDLPSRPASMDAAIEAALRSMQRFDSTEEALDRLLSEHPEHADAIAAAASLNELFRTPTATQVERAEGGPLPEPPFEFGPEIEAGRRRYVARRLIASGAEGSVFETLDRMMSVGGDASIVAAKVLRRPIAEEDAPLFAEEAMVGRRVEHARVARVFDAGRLDEGRPFVIHSLVDGLPLDRWAATTKRENWQERCVRLIASLAEAVQAAHAAGFVHCDLKPSNVIVREGDAPTLVDFGVARRFTTRFEEAPAEESGQGNAAFAPPEQINPARGRLTVASDVYALGGMLYWLLTDELPAGETMREIRETFSNADARVEHRDRRLREVGVDRDLAAICRRALCVEPEKRYASAAQFEDDLGRWRRHETLSWRRPSLAWQTRLAVRRRPWLALGGAAAALALGASLTWSVIAVRAIAISTARDADARAAQEEIAEIRERDMNIIAYLEEVRDGFDEAKLDGMITSRLSELWVQEWAYGPLFFRDPRQFDEVWATRINLVRKLRDHHLEMGGPDSMGVMLTEPMLGLWLARAGRLDDAAAMVDSGLERAERILTEGDPWIDRLRTIKHSVEGQRLALLAPLDEPGRDERMRDHVAWLKEANERLGVDPSSDQIRLLALQSIEVLGSLDGLADRALVDWAAQEIDELGLPVPERGQRLGSERARRIMNPSELRDPETPAQSVSR